MQILLLPMFPRGSLHYLWGFLIFFLFDWSNFIILSSSLLIHLNVSSNLIFISSSVFLISVILLFISDLFSFIFFC